MNKKLEKMCLKLLFKGKFSNGKIKEKISSKLFEDKIVMRRIFGIGSVNPATEMR